jgi:glycogen synthase
VLTTRKSFAVSAFSKSIEMKLLVYSHFFAPSVGGVEDIALSLAKGLAQLEANSFNVTVATQTPAGEFPDASLPFSIVRQPGMLRLWGLVRNTDVVHVSGPSLLPMFCAKLAGKPLVVEHHGYQAVCPNGLLLHQPDRTVCPGHFQSRRYSECLRCQNSELSLLGALARLLLMFPRSALSRRAAKNLAITQHVAQRQALPRSSVLYYGVQECCQPSGVPTSTRNDRPISFAYVGRLVPEKGLSVLVDATAILQKQGYNLDVQFVGDGPERAHIQLMIAAHKLEHCMRITGFLSGQTLADALRDTQVVVMPSIWEETAGLAAMEQMMRGRLVIAANIGGLSEVLADAGLKFLPGNSQALAATMRNVLQNPALIDSLGRKAGDRAKTLFARTRMIEEHAAIYRSLAQNKAAPRQDERQ